MAADRKPFACCSAIHSTIGSSSSRSRSVAFGGAEPIVSRTDNRSSSPTPVRVLASANVSLLYVENRPYAAVSMKSSVRSPGPERRGQRVDRESGLAHGLEDARARCIVLGELVARIEPQDPQADQLVDRSRWPTPARSATSAAVMPMPGAADFAPPAPSVVVSRTSTG